MNSTNKINLLRLLSVCAIMPWCHAQQVVGFNQQRRTTALPDLAKVAIETPIKSALSKRLGQLRTARPDMRKALVEAPLKNLLSREAALRFATIKKVQPGKVHWHKNFTAARLAAKTSGKPVLHFQMLGRLDDEFC